MIELIAKASGAGCCSTCIMQWSDNGPYIPVSSEGCQALLPMQAPVVTSQFIVPVGNMDGQFQSALKADDACRQVLDSGEPRSDT